MIRSSEWSLRSLALGSLLMAALPGAAEVASHRFYVPQNTFSGSQALTACAKGDHMASLGEILNASTPSYDTKLGVATQDSAAGHP